MKILSIAIFGVLGVLTRYSIDSFFNQISNNKDQFFPYATFSANIIGCFIAGFLYSLINQKVEADELKKRVEILNKLSLDEMSSVKSVIFEETEKSSRRYFYYGLVFSIPLFWMSEYLKNLLAFLLMRVEFLRRLAPFSSKPQEF